MSSVFVFVCIILQYFYLRPSKPCYTVKVLQGPRMLTRRHLCVKHERFPHQDFDSNSELKLGVIGLLEEVLRDPDLLPQERKGTTNILR